MSLAERLKEPPVSTSRQNCTVGKILTRLEREDPDLKEWLALANTLANPEWSGSQIADALKAEGHLVDVRQVREHRIGRHNIRNCATPHAGLLK